MHSQLDQVGVEITVLLGRALIPMQQLLRMGRGAVIQLDTQENDEVWILANNYPVARGEIGEIGREILGQQREFLERGFFPRTVNRIDLAQAIRGHRLPLWLTVDPSGSSNCRLRLWRGCLDGGVADGLVGGAHDRRGSLRIGGVDGRVGHQPGGGTGLEPSAPA